MAFGAITSPTAKCSPVQDDREGEHHSIPQSKLHSPTYGESLDDLLAVSYEPPSFPYMQVGMHARQEPSQAFPLSILPTQSSTSGDTGTSTSIGSPIESTSSLDSTDTLESSTIHPSFSHALSESTATTSSVSGTSSSQSDPVISFLSTLSHSGSTDTISVLTASTPLPTSTSNSAYTQTPSEPTSSADLKGVSHPVSSSRSAGKIVGGVVGGVVALVLAMLAMILLLRRRRRKRLDRIPPSYEFMRQLETMQTPSSLEAEEGEALPSQPHTGRIWDDPLMKKVTEAWRARGGP